MLQRFIRLKTDDDPWRKKTTIIIITICQTETNRKLAKLNATTTAAMASFEGEIEISIGGPLAPKQQDNNVEDGTSSSSSFLSNLFDPSIVDLSYTSTTSEHPKFAPPSVIMIEEIDDASNSSGGFNGTISIINETENGGGGGGGGDGGGVDPAQYEHDVYFVLVVVTVSLTVFVMVVFAIYRIVETVMEARDRRSDRRSQRQNGGTPGAASGSIPPPSSGGTPGGAVTGNPQGRSNSVEFLSGN